MTSQAVADAIIVGAGHSQRMDGIDKVFAPLGGRPLLCHSVEVFEASPLIKRIIVALSQDNLDHGRELAAARGWHKARLCVGGERRQDSVRAGLDCLDGAEWIVVHDAARPMLTADLIERGLQAAQRSGAAVCAVPIADTVKLIGAYDTIIETLPRERLRAVQTPQVFRYSLLMAAHRATATTATDDAAMVEALGHHVVIYEGSMENIKVTTPVDLSFAEAILQRRATLTRTD